ncbi:MAG: hypothetical protein M0Q44_03775 [Methylobacter sp.]|jgi:hypothetical protein|nr:hypothetical protein [Methylobacter sp.]
MGLIYKTILIGTIALVLIAKSIESKKETEANQANSASTTMNNIVQSTIRFIQTIQQKPNTPTRQRICKIKPTGDEECKYL